MGGAGEGDVDKGRACGCGFNFMCEVELYSKSCTTEEVSGSEDVGVKGEAAAAPCVGEGENNSLLSTVRAGRGGGEGEGVGVALAGLAQGEARLFVTGFDKFRSMTA